MLWFVHLNRDAYKYVMTCVVSQVILQLMQGVIVILITSHILTNVGFYVYRY